MSMKNSSDTIGNRTHDLPTCSAVPQPTAPPRKILGRFAKLRKVTVSFVLSVMSIRMKEIGSRLPPDCHDIWQESIFRKPAEKIQALLQSNKNNGTSHEYQCTFMIPSRSFLLRMRNVSDKRCSENRNTHFMFNNIPESRAVYEIMWKNAVEPGRSQTTIWRMRIAYWITRATETHSEYVILIAFPRQQWLR